MREATGRTDELGGQVWTSRGPGRVRGAKSAAVAPDQHNHSESREAVPAGAGDLHEAITAMVRAEPEWKLAGACVGRYADVEWYALSKMEGFPAKMICWDECPVREQCLAYALDHDEAGCWGGTLRYERDKIKASGWQPRHPLTNPPRTDKRWAGHHNDGHNPEHLHTIQALAKAKRDRKVADRRAVVASLLAEGKTTKEITVITRVTKRTTDRDIQAVKAQLREEAS